MRSLALALALAGAGCAGKEKPMPDPLTEARADWLRIVESLGDSAFEPIEAEALPTKVFMHSLDWERRIFRSGAGPSRAAPKARCGVHATRPDTLDLLRYDYRRGDVRVTVTESSQFVHVRFREIPEKLGRDPIRQTEALAALFLETPEPPRFQPDPSAPDVFSTAPSVGAARMHSWLDRFDAHALGDGLAILCYKFDPDKPAHIPPRQWFDADFRAKWKR